jgi:hypothetical protein
MHTLEQLRDGARALADMEDEGEDGFVPATLWNSWISQAVKELQRLLISANPDSYLSTYNFTLTTDNVVTLPEDFYGIRGLTLNPDASNRQTIHKFQFGERDVATSTVNAWGGYPASRRYRVVSRTQLIIEPKLSCAGDYRLYYIPLAPRLAAPVTTDEFDIETTDTPIVAVPGLPGNWSLTNAAFDDEVMPEDGTAELHLTLGVGPPDNSAFSGTYLITDILSATLATCSNLTSSAGYTLPAEGTGFIVYQPVGTVPELDENLEPYAEYIMVVTAIKALEKEESDTTGLEARRNILRQDILENSNLDDNEPNTIVDTRNGNDGWQ